ncbi:MAG TPA: 5-(carboxyamino)imidazole ribonucleotide mutase [Saprospiraceae bacterium]|nr:5-(carboxyamino)imidazole ribonucleotide mutase [Saprospiraceae bacterium]HQW56915.1 5-(carboxyamino)imidazole ribonucleotide mutase [Saprospiraceae bacterium]
MNNTKPLVGIIMGSDSDWPVMKAAAEILSEFDISYETKVVSAHRTPQEMLAYGTDAYKMGMRVIIAGAGGAAHLPGMIAAVSILPVIGVPVKSSNSIDGWDSVLSILQMPKGVPVATVALDNATNAGLLAVQILATSNSELCNKLIEYKNKLREQALSKKLD